MNSAVSASGTLQRLIIKYSTPAILNERCKPNTPSLPLISPKPVSQADNTTNWVFPKYKLPALLAKQFNSQNNKAKQKDEDADAVNTVHIPNPFVFGTVGVLLFKVEVFRYLFPDSHTVKLY